ncbi:MAG TPA: hypothetical protein VER36_00190 [Flavisolibacter sp.]|nr:hypothetical protein [Flavisolibacter sp.]
MKEHLTFHKLVRLCQLNNEKKYVTKCLSLLENEVCIFNSGVVLPQEKVASLYDFRLQNKKRDEKFDNRLLNDYENTVACLKNSKSLNLGITMIFGEAYSFIIFYEPDAENILGILKSKTSSSLKSIEENATETVNNGLSCGSEKYNKGILIRKWE